MGLFIEFSPCFCTTALLWRVFGFLLLSEARVKTVADGIDQDQTAHNVQSDLKSIPSTLKVELC